MIIKKLVSILLDFSGEKIIIYCEDELKKGTSPYEIFTTLSKGLEEIGKKFESGRYFTSDLIVSGSNMKKAVDYLRPLFVKGSNEHKGKVLIGTVKGDVHDIGKIIFSMMLQSQGFEVIDLGVDVDESAFLTAIKSHNPDILAMSTLLTSTQSNMESVIENLKKSLLRDKVKIIVGGRPIDKQYAEDIGADAYGKDAVEGVRECLALMEGE
jgi:methanogenic corrinoid protein MtbC1